MTNRKRTGSIKPCVGCGRPIRPSHWSAKEHPGTLIHTGNGICGGCRSRGVRGEINDSKARSQELALEENKRSLDAFLNRISADRRRLEQRKKVRMVIR